MSDMIRVVEQHIGTMLRRSQPEHPEFKTDDPERLARLYKWRAWLLNPASNPHLIRTQ